MKRMGISAVVLTVATLLAGPTQVVWADATSDARKAVTAAYGKQMAAFERKDFNAVFATYAPDFTNTSETGKTTTLAEMKQQVAMFRMMKSIQPKATITKFALKGNMAMCTVKEHVVLKAAGQNGKIATIAIDDTSDDVWVKTAKGWLQKSGKTQHSKQTQM